MSLNKEHLYIIMVGLPARGKTTITGKIAESLKRDGIHARVFNNGDLRRKLSKENTSYPEFFDPKNKEGVALREHYAVINLNKAKEFITKGGAMPRTAIIDATNVSVKRRRMLCSMLPEENVLFIECINNDHEILEANIRHKVEIPEFNHLTRKNAVASLKKRIEYYEGIYSPLKREKNFIKIDSFNYRILKEKLSNDIPFIDRIRDFIVTPFIKNLYLIRHTETYYNVENRIGGNPDLTHRGKEQAKNLSREFKEKKIPLIFTSALKRTMQTAMPVKKTAHVNKIIPLEEFNEINGGICESMTYDEISKEMPEVAAARKRNKYFYKYPEGEGYVSMEKRIERGIKKVLYLSNHYDNIMIVGHRAVNRMILSYFVYRRKEDIPYIYMPQDRYYHIVISQNKKLLELKKYTT